MHPLRHLVRFASLGLALVAVLLLAAVPAVAKEGLTARLDAPIAMGTPPGTEILVGMTVTVPGEVGDHPVEGTPMYLKLIGRDGAVTRAAGAADRTPGHYTMRIAIPDGGVRDIEIGIHGSSDLPIMLVNDPFTFGGVTAATAQLAPPVPPMLTPLPRTVETAPLPAPASPAAPGAAATAPGIPVLVASVGLLGVALIAAAGVLLVRRRRAVAGASTSASRSA